MRERRMRVMPPSDDPALLGVLARLHPYARHLVRQAEARALRLHADWVTPDHLMLAIMSDPDCAASTAVVHAFADPATIEHESLATAPGVMVVASDSVRAFSTHGLEVLLSARAAAIDAHEATVTEKRLLIHAYEALSAELQAVLLAVGFQPDVIHVASAEHAASHASESDPLFKHFSIKARQALSAANRIAAEFGNASISPADLLLGCLKLADADGARPDHGVGFQRARKLLAGRTADDAPPVPREVPADPRLARFLSEVPAGATSLDLLEHFLAGDTPELAQVLLRQKVTPALLQRAKGVFRDPPAPPDDAA